MTYTGGIINIDIKGEVSKVSPDNTVGLVSTYDPERFPDSLILDPERLERALIAVREEFDNPGAINLALVCEKGDDDDPDLALYPENERDRAVIIAPRHRQTDEGAEPGELQEIEADKPGRPEPEKSEPADFGGGESTGVQDL